MNLFGKIFGNLIPDKTTEQYVDQDYLIELEEQLLRTDCGLSLTESIINQITGKKINTFEAQEIIREYCQTILKKAQNNSRFEENTKKLQIIFITGVNGSGKTTSIGKLAYKFKAKGKKVLIAPCDRFRAAASEQVNIWAERAGVEIHLPTQGERQKANSILYEAIQKAKTKNHNTLLVDTAGRLQNKQELMDELASLSKVIDKHTTTEDTAIERWLVIDSTTGQNGLQQAREFNKASPLSGIILTKYDGSAKGGIILAIAEELSIPIHYLGVGEGIDQLEPFSAEEFIQENMLRG